MRSLPVLALLAAAASACGPYRGWVPVEVDWTFGGKSCADAGVASIQIDVEGEILTPNKFTCAEASKGADLGTFLTGTYSVTVTGLDDASNVIYQGQRTVQVRGSSRNVFAIDALPTTGSATVHWTFDGQTCAQAGVAAVRISVDGQAITDANGFPCSSPAPGGGTVDGSTIAPLSPGSHTIALAATGSSQDYAVDNVNITVTAGQDTLVPVDLPPATPTTASADVRWNFQPGGKTCADVGVDQIYVVFDPQPDGSGGTVVANTACAGLGGAPVTEMSIVDVPDGYHSFAIRGTRQNTLIYYTHQPVQTLFTAPFTTAVDVTAEPTP